MDMTSTAEASRWYENQRLAGSPNTSLAAHQASGGGLDSSEMGAFYALENGGPHAHRRYYSGYGPHHGMFFYIFFF